jgi:hypothetical protein
LISLGDSFSPRLLELRSQLLAQLVQIRIGPPIAVNVGHRLTVRGEKADRAGPDANLAETSGLDGQRR